MGYRQSDKVFYEPHPHPHPEAKDAPRTGVPVNPVPMKTPPPMVKPKTVR